MLKSWQTKGRKALIEICLAKDVSGLRTRPRASPRPGRGGDKSPRPPRIPSYLNNSRVHSAVDVQELATCALELYYKHLGPGRPPAASGIAIPTLLRRDYIELQKGHFLQAVRTPYSLLNPYTMQGGSDVRGFTQPQSMDALNTRPPSTAENTSEPQLFPLKTNPQGGSFVPPTTQELVNPGTAGSLSGTKSADASTTAPESAGGDTATGSKQKHLGSGETNKKATSAPSPPFFLGSGNTFREQQQCVLWTTMPQGVALGHNSEHRRARRALSVWPLKA